MSEGADGYVFSSEAQLTTRGSAQTTPRSEQTTRGAQTTRQRRRYGTGQIPCNICQANDAAIRTMKAR
jgi:hypothetical protein